MSHKKRGSTTTTTREWFNPLPRELARLVWEELSLCDRYMLIATIDPSIRYIREQFETLLYEVRLNGYTTLEKWLINDTTYVWDHVEQEIII